MLLGITGTDGAGKGTVVEYLVAQKGFVHYSARDIWIHELVSRGMETTRSNMRLIANEMRERFGDDFLITYYIQKIKEDETQHAIIESIRAVAEATTLKKNNGLLIAVDADQTLRYARVQERRSETDKVSFAQFTAHEALEAQDPNPHGMQKQKVMSMADYIVTNNGTREELYTQVERCMHSLGMDK